MNDAFGDPLVIEMEDFLAKMKVIDQGRPAGANAKRVLIVSHRATLSGRQNIVAVFGELMKLAPWAAVKLLIVDGYRVDIGI
jgi:hypothetical protein